MSSVGQATLGRTRAAIGEATRRGLWLAVGALTVLVAFSLAVFPIRQYLDQRSTTAARSQTLLQLQRENERLQAKIDELKTPEVIEQIARAEFSLVFPGDEVYVVLPPKTSAPVVPPAWPFTR